MSDRRQVWATLAALLQRLEADVAQRERGEPGESSLDGVKDEIRKLGKAQFKANTLAETQNERWQEAFAALQDTQAQNRDLLETLEQERQAAADRKLLEAIIPALDGLENAIASGRGYLRKRDQAATAVHQTPAQQGLVSPADRKMLAGWLDGLRLVRERLLAILEAGGVTPIPTVGLAFDPYLHRAVGTTATGGDQPGEIVSEERPGYQSTDGVLRYADVIVYKPEDGNK